LLWYFIGGISGVPVEKGLKVCVKGRVRGEFRGGEGEAAGSLDLKRAPGGGKGKKRGKNSRVKKGIYKKRQREKNKLWKVIWGDEKAKNHGQKKVRRKGNCPQPRSKGKRIREKDRKKSGESGKILKEPGQYGGKGLPKK